jgi:hypothetical protein
MTYKYPPASIDMLKEHCDQKYAVFSSFIHLGIDEKYRKFKSDLKDDMNYLFESINKSNNNELTLELLHHLNRQLNFIYKNETVCHPNDMKDFMNLNYPYKEKVDEIISKYQLELDEHNKKARDVQYKESKNKKFKK